MGYLFRRKLDSGEPCAKWTMRYYVGGRRFEESTGTTDKEEAKRILKAKEGDVAKGTAILPRGDRVKFDEAVKDLVTYYTISGDRNLEEAGYRLANLQRFFEGRKLAKITAQDTTEYAAKRQEEGATNGTIHRELGVLRRMLRLAAENGKLVRMPAIRMLKENAPRAGFLEQGQFEAVRQRIEPSLQAAVTVAFTYGWRVRSEVFTLRLNQVDLVAGTLCLDPGQTKNDDGRVVYLTEELKALLTAQVDRVKAFMRKRGAVIPHLFPHQAGRYQGQPRRDFVKAWKTACENAGVRGMLRHDFRRTAVRNLVNAGVSERVAMQIIGHKTRAVFDRYHIVSPADLQEAAQKLVTTFSTTPANSPLAPNRATALEFTPRPGSSTGRVPAF